MLDVKVCGHLSLFHAQVELTAHLQMERETETLSATMANTLKVSETSETTADQEECFYDCDDTLHVEDTSPVRQADVPSEIIKDKGSETEMLGNTDVNDKSCLNTTLPEHEYRSAEKTLDSLARDPDQENFERFVEDDGTRDSDSDSEFKEAASTVKVSEYDEEYLRELEKDLTEEEKEASVFVLDFTSIKNSMSACSIFPTIVHDASYCYIVLFMICLFQSQSRRKESLELKEKGNTQFKSGGKRVLFHFWVNR